MLGPPGTSSATTLCVLASLCVCCGSDGTSATEGQNLCHQSCCSDVGVMGRARTSAKKSCTGRAESCGQIRARSMASTGAGPGQNAPKLQKVWAGGVQKRHRYFGARKRAPITDQSPQTQLQTQLPAGSPSHGSPGAAVPVLQGHLPHLPGAPAALPGALTSSWLRPSWILGAVHRASLCQASRPGSAPAASGIWGWALTWPGCWLRGGAGNNFSCATRRACQRLTLFFTKRRTFIS